MTALDLLLLLPLGVGTVQGYRRGLVLEAWLETTEAARAQAFEALGARLDDASRQHRGAKALDEKLFGADFEAA